MAPSKVLPRIPRRLVDFRAENCIVGGVREIPPPTETKAMTSADLANAFAIVNAAHEAVLANPLDDALFAAFEVAEADFEALADAAHAAIN